MAILHLPQLVGFRPYRFNKDTVRSQMEEATAMRRVEKGLMPLWPYHTPNAMGSSVPAVWWKEAQMRSWKVWIADLGPHLGTIVRMIPILPPSAPSSLLSSQVERQGAAVDQI